MVSVNKLSAFIDFFNFLPFKIKKTKNNSKDIYYVMSSNQKGEATYEKETKQDEEKAVFTEMLSMISSKINERFNSINAAFRFFDSDYDQNINFNDFAQGVEYLRVKLSYEDIWKIYRYLDTNGDGQISYSEFCQLCEEKWRKIDPF